MLSNRYTARAVGPPLENSTLMYRSIPCDGTSRYSIGWPALENAPAVADPPATFTNPGATEVASATIANRFTQPLDFPPLNAIAAPSLRPQPRLQRTIRATGAPPVTYEQLEVAGRGARHPVGNCYKNNKNGLLWIATSSSTSPAAR
jgi:hypothetical protein